MTPAAEKPEEGIGEEKDFEKLFSLENVIAAPAAVVENSDESTDKKKEKKKKKDRELEFDESRGEVVARKKHKRGDDSVEVWE